MMINGWISAGRVLAKVGGLEENIKKSARRCGHPN